MTIRRGAEPANGSWAVLDLDGVVADVRPRLVHLARRPKDWEAFFAAIPTDAPLAAGVALAHELAERFRLVYVSGRPERTRADTADWLRAHALPPAPLHLRREGDRRPARVAKVSIIRGLARQAPVGLVVDDDPQVLEACRAAGWPVRLATWGQSLPGPARQDQLRLAQEELGRT